MHGITKLDRGIVGLVPNLGHTWHGFANYVEIDDHVTFDQTMEVVDYEVVKIPLAFHVPDELLAKFPNHMGFVPQCSPDRDGLTGPLMYALVRADTGNQVFEQSVSGEYTIYQNRVFLEKIHDLILKDNPQVVIESAGTLFAGRICFINLILNQFQVGRDDSMWIARIMFYNAFGGRSITACVCFIRVVCNNTMMLGEAQGALNATLRKFRHTPGAPDKVANHIVNLAELQKVTEAKKQCLDWMASQQMTDLEVKNFLGNLFEISDDDGQKKTTARQNRRNEIEKIFDETDNLQGEIKHTRYSMLNAVTDYNQHHTIPENSTEVDDAFAWWDVSTGGVRNDLNQKAFNILIKPIITEPKKKSEKKEEVKS